jgi:hypothetical protein
MARITPAEIARGWRALTSDQQLDAQLLIDAVYAWIKDPSRRPDLSDDDPIGMRVVIEVVRAALGTRPEFANHTQYAKVIGPWQISGTLATPAGTLGFTRQQLDLLGISNTPLPSGEFGDPCGFRYPPPESVLP